jgi:hypothetical protein
MTLRGTGPAVLWALLILLLCLMPGPALPKWDWADLFSLDKPVHAILFAVQFVLLVRALARDTWRSGPGSRVLVLAFLLTVAYGVLTEVMQHLEALGRHGNVNDALANTVGALLGAGYLRWRSRRERSAGSTKVA